jgi:hypothetical protein
MFMVEMQERACRLMLQHLHSKCADIVPNQALHDELHHAQLRAPARLPACLQARTHARRLQAQP